MDIYYMTANSVFSKFSKSYMDLNKDLPIRPSEMGVINIVCLHKGDFTPLMLAKMLGVSKPMITAHLNTLIKKGYIYKEQSENDKRSFYVRPTEKGKELADEFGKSRTKCLKRIEAEMGQENFSTLFTLMVDFEEILEKILEENKENDYAE